MIKNQFIKVIYPLYLIVGFMVFAPLSLWAQNMTVTGTVTDNNNEPLPGVNILIKGSLVGTITDMDGRYSLSIDAPDQTLIFSFIGYLREEVPVEGKSIIDMVMYPDIQMMSEVVVVGYGTQKKVTLTGAVASIKGAEMLKTKNENPQNMLTGRIAGVRVWQKSAEPGTFNNNFDIRGLGAPLIVIDGVQSTTAEFQRLNPDDIEDISALKDASAAIYGIRAANGVILVTTKKGTKDGKTTVSYNGSYTLQQPSKMPRLADAFGAMTLYNEQSMNDVKGGNIVFGEDKFEAYRNGTLRSEDWNSLIFSDFSPQTQHNLSISGGTNKTQYYISMGYFFQEGFFKSGDLNYEKYNLRSNISTELTKGLTLDLNLNGMTDQRNNPYSSSVDIIKNYWRQGVLFPAYADPENTMLSHEGLDLEENTVAKMTSDISGYRKYNQKYFQSTVALNFDFGTVSSILDGLSAKALFSYNYRKDDNDINRREYYQYTYNASTDSYIPKLYVPSSPNQIRREMFDKQQVLSQFLLNYDRTFNKQHNVSGVLGGETQKLMGDNFYALRELAFGTNYLLAGVEENQRSGMQRGFNDIYDVAYEAMFGRLNYTYADRYIAEVQFRYDGSSRFAKDYRWGFFPSASVGWRLSQEPFFRSVTALDFVDQLKLRASYGVLGDDFLGSEDWPYDWMAGYTYPAESGGGDNGYYNRYAPGAVIDGKFVLGASALALPNEQITWFTSHTLDIGVDFEGWNGLFGFSLDYFDRRREGRFAQRKGELPTVVGAEAPRENRNSDRHFGIDLELNHQNTVGEFSYKVKAIGTITRQQYLVAVDKGPWANSYDRWRHDNLNNRYQGVQFGYEAAGRYEDWEDIWSYPIYKDISVLPGDYKYVDWNGDGEINGQDEHPIAFDQTPWMNFSLGGDLSYKALDMSLLLQGSALGSMAYKEPLYAIWGYNGGGTLEQYLDRWHPVDPLADPYDPATEWVSGYYGYTGHYPKENSEFNRVSTAYLRLKSIELGYTLPKRSPSSSMNVRVYANAYNLYTITGVKFVDPEHPDSDNGRLYPLNKTYTLGVSVTF